MFKRVNEEGILFFRKEEVILCVKVSWYSFSFIYLVVINYGNTDFLNYFLFNSDYFFRRIVCVNDF